MFCFADHTNWAKIHVCVERDGDQQLRHPLRVSVVYVCVCVCMCVCGCVCVGVVQSVCAHLCVTEAERQAGERIEREEGKGERDRE